MKNNQLSKELFFSRTNDFLNIYLPKQAMKSNNTINTYRDGLMHIPQELRIRSGGTERHSASS